MPGVVAAAARRSSGVWAPPEDANTAHWWCGDDVVVVSDEIERFAAKHGPEDLIQAAAVNRPDYSASIAMLGGPPGGEFVASAGHYLSTAVLATPIAQPFSVVVAFGHNSLPANFQAICGAAPGSSSRWILRSNSGNNLEIFAGGSVASIQSQAIDTAYTGVFVFNGASSKARVNGVSVYSGSTNIGNNGVVDVAFGRELNATYLDGPGAELAIRTGDLIADAAALSEWESYLAARYL